jgi:hypothetical protein
MARVQEIFTTLAACPSALLSFQSKSNKLAEHYWLEACGAGGHLACRIFGQKDMFCSPVAKTA